MFLFFLLMSCHSGSCGEVGRACQVPSGQFLISRAKTAKPAPVVLYFHGAGSSAEAAFGSAALERDLVEQGYHVVYMDGDQGSWSVSMLDWGRRDELAFTEEVLDFLLENEDIDQSRIYAAGFSLGSSVVWDLACYQSHRFAGFFAQSGQYWSPMPTSCPGPSRPLFHLHGTTDTTFPLEGQSFSPTTAQGDARLGFKTFTDRGQCAAPTHSFTDELQCDSWCDDELSLCTHDGGHRPLVGWVQTARTFWQSQTP